MELIKKHIKETSRWRVACKELISQIAEKLRNSSTGKMFVKKAYMCFDKGNPSVLFSLVSCIILLILLRRYLIDV